MSVIQWTETSTTHVAHWHSESATPPPSRVVYADDRMRADTAYRLARTETALLWRGDFHNGRQLLQAMSRRCDRQPIPESKSLAEAFRLHRKNSARRARVLGKLLVLLDDDHGLRLRRAPDVRQACRAAYGSPSGSKVVALTELLGVLGAQQWRTKGVEIPALQARIHPHYGVFSPVRGEYVDLVAHTPLPAAPDLASRRAFDLGTGTGVLAAVLARRGIGQIVATDISPRALHCARANIRRLDLAGRVDVLGPGLFPAGRADLIVCNPPWLPARPTSDLELGVYDADGSMLGEFLAGLRAHLEP
ncbi:methyltransferase, partial [Streptomyces roseolus]|uniref:methyltransferase n=1 Tax=Streptomyces roseolus TaxID=67358 RepID=UPI00364F7C6D